MWFDRFLSSPAHEKIEEHTVPAQHIAENLEFKTPVSFTSDESRQDGQCLSISDSGLQAVFEHPPEPWTEGQLVITVLEKPISIPARVARVSGHEVGFFFLISNDEELAPITALIDSILNPEANSPVEGTDMATPNPNEDQAISASDVSKAE